jgi:hypothetical protein
MRNVITYREAYRDNRWTLCAWHAGSAAEPVRDAAGMGPLGPVEHGEREGECDLCGAAR